MEAVIEAGYETLVSGRDAGFGAVRIVSPDGLLVYVAKAGLFYVPADAICAVHSKQVVLDRRRLGTRLRSAIARAGP